MKRQFFLPIFAIIVLFLFQNCTEKITAPHTDEIEVTYKEKYRPQYHFTPKANWMNDPNGLVYNNGQWHLFYQHNPWGNRWGHMSWGHAVTRDLIHWGHLPIALYEEPNEGSSDSTMIFSGGAIMDKGNRARLCPDGTQDCMVAFYTGHIEGKNQHQSLAFSPDNGATWTKYPKNPIIDLNMKDFRDPKVFYHNQSQQWVMAVVLPKEYKVLFYGSKNLIDWTKMSEFGGVGDISKIWECPDLFELKVTNEPGVKKWVLVVSGGNSNINSGAMQYFIGQFDGQKFTLDEGETGSHYLDYGRDFYAGVTWNDDPYRRRLMIGWMNNWDYANDIPTTPWKSAQSLVRQLVMTKKDSTYKIHQMPLRDLKNLQGKYAGYSDFALPTSLELFDKIRFKSGEIQALFNPVEVGLASNFGLKVFVSKGENGEVLEQTIIGYDTKKEVLYIDRNRSGNVDFNKTFADRVEAPLKWENNEIMLHIFIDHSTIEVFANNGEVVMSQQVFPNLDEGRIELFAKGGQVQTKHFSAWEYKSIWE